MSKARSALVTGANRGIGFETCRQLARLGYRVVMTARDDRLGTRSADRLRREGFEVRFERMDLDHAPGTGRFPLSEFGECHVPSRCPASRGSISGRRLQVLDPVDHI